MPKPLTLSQKFERFPPVVVRLLARVPVADGGVRAITDEEISVASGLSTGEIRTLARLTTWDDTPIATMQAFCRGCGADLDNRDWLRKNAAYMATIRSIPRYLRKSNAWPTTFEPLIRIWLRQAA